MREWFGSGVVYFSKMDLIYCDFQETTSVLEFEDIFF